MTGTAGPLDPNVPLSFASRNTEDSGETKLQCNSLLLGSAFYKGRKCDAFLRPEQKFLARERIPLAECEISQCSALTNNVPFSCEQIIAVMLTLYSSLLLMY